MCNFDDKSHFKITGMEPTKLEILQRALDGCAWGGATAVLKEDTYFITCACGQDLNAVFKSGTIPYKPILSNYLRHAGTTKCVTQRTELASAMAGAFAYGDGGGTTSGYVSFIYSYTLMVL